jgi:hypothetical protein
MRTGATPGVASAPDTTHPLLFFGGTLETAALGPSALLTSRFRDTAMT